MFATVRNPQSQSWLTVVKCQRSRGNAADLFGLSRGPEGPEAIATFCFPIFLSKSIGAVHSAKLRQARRELADGSGSPQGPWNRGHRLLRFLGGGGGVRGYPLQAASQACLADDYRATLLTLALALRVHLHLHLHTCTLAPNTSTYTDTYTYSYTYPPTPTPTCT